MEMNEEAWQDPAAVTAPTLLVRGAESYILSEQTAAKMRDTLANCSFAEVEGAGHLVPSDRPGALKAAVRAYLGYPAVTPPSMTNSDPVL